MRAIAATTLKSQAGHMNVHGHMSRHTKKLKVLVWLLNAHLTCLVIRNWLLPLVCGYQPSQKNIKVFQLYIDYRNHRNVGTSGSIKIGVFTANTYPTYLVIRNWLLLLACGCQWRQQLVMSFKTSEQIFKQHQFLLAQCGSDMQFQWMTSLVITEWRKNNRQCTIDRGNVR